MSHNYMYNNDTSQLKSLPIKLQETRKRKRDIISQNTTCNSIPRNRL